MLYLSTFLLLGMPFYANQQILTKNYFDGDIYGDYISENNEEIQDFIPFRRSGFVTLSVNPDAASYTRSRNQNSAGRSDPNDMLIFNPYFRSNSRNIHGDVTYNEPSEGIVKRGFSVEKRRYRPEAANKVPISRYQMRKFPYANIVRLSSGCTGTLLTPYHVITAAHCVHDGVNFKENIEMLKVQVPDKYGYRMHYVVKINVPIMWIRSQVLPGYAYDYAVLRLNLPVTGKENFMQLALPSIKTKYSDLHFFGFFPEKFNALWESTCLAEKSHFVYGGNAVLTKCESAVGNSGAAVFAADAVDGNKIIGILSSSLSQSDATEYEAIMLLTLSKCLDICAMIYPQGEKYDVCIQVKRNEIQYLKMGANRIMPFFG